MFSRIAPSSAELARIWTKRGQHRLSLGRRRPSSSECIWDKLDPNSSNAGPISSKVGRHSPNLGLWPDLGRLRPDLGQLPPKFVKCGPETATFGPILIGFGPNFPNIDRNCSNHACCSDGRAFVRVSLQFLLGGPFGREDTGGQVSSICSQHPPRAAVARTLLPGPISEEASNIGRRFQPTSGQNLPESVLHKCGQPLSEFGGRRVNITLAFVSAFLE